MKRYEKCKPLDDIFFQYLVEISKEIKSSVISVYKLSYHISMILQPKHSSLTLNATATNLLVQISNLATIYIFNQGHAART